MSRRADRASPAEAGIDLLRERLSQVPALLHAAGEAPEPDLALDPRRVRRFAITGIGASEGNARFLASVLAEELDLPARFTAPAALARSGGGPEDALVVFSHALSPNVAWALAHPERWARVVLVTAVRPGDFPPERVALLERARDAGARVVPMPPALDDERRTLVRVAGPLVGYALALRIAGALARRAALPAPEFPAARVCEAMERAAAAVSSAFPEETPLPFDSALPLALLASGGYGERVRNLRFKVMEGMRVPAPPIWDLLEFAHGPFQQLYDRPALLVMLARGATAEGPDEGLLRERLRAMLPAHHDLRVLSAALPGGLAVFEHEAAWNALLVRWLSERGVDPRDWPGKDRDAPLYELRPSAPRSPAHARREPERPAAALAGLTWPELEAALADGRTTAVWALGSTEQHGPHLPFATDTWVAEALSARICAQRPEAVALPALALGCASEHLGFPGTLSLDPSTLEAVLGDVLRALAAHGFERAFLFSAHGGNVAVLHDALPRLRQRAAPLSVIAFTDHDALADALAAAAAARGVSAEAAGHHAGEMETSVVSALRPDAVRRSALAAGRVAPCDEPQRLFYPDLRANAPSGVVGDPRGADPARGEAYLAVWVELLLRHYRAEKKRHQTNGTVKP